MRKYIILHRIKTMSTLYDPFQLDGFEFKHWDFNLREGFIGDFWIAKKIIIATNFIEAINGFRSQLQQLIEKMSFVGQTYFSCLEQPFLIFKDENESNKIFFIRYSEESKSVGLPFNKDEIDSLKTIKDATNQEFYTYWNESNNAISYKGKLTMLIKSLEALAGAIQKVDKCIYGRANKRTSTDLERIKLILNDKDLYEDIFGKGGIRHKLSHGKKVNFEKRDYVLDIYNAIIKHFNDYFHISINTKVKNPQRNPYGNYRGRQNWCIFKNEIKLDLKHILEIFKDLSMGKAEIDEIEFCEASENY